MTNLQKILEARDALVSILNEAAINLALAGKEAEAQAVEVERVAIVESTAKALRSMDRASVLAHYAGAEA